MSVVHICELFTSIQGESTYAGLPCFFIRLAGCNLRCRYCDTEVAHAPGEEHQVADLVAAAHASAAPLVEVTGGEPLIQSGVPGLIAALLETGKTVLVETNGSQDISLVPDAAVTIMDVKTPGSGEPDAFDEANIERLGPNDEVKFVLCNRNDYLWAKDFVTTHRLADRCGAVLFSPVFNELDAAQLGHWIVDDGLPVRLQLQMHKIMGFR